MLAALQLLIELLNLAVGEVKLLLNALTLGQDVVCWLISAFDKSLVQLGLSLCALKLLLQFLDLL